MPQEATVRATKLVWPEGLRPLLVLGLVSTLIMFVIAALVFLAIYVSGGVPIAALFDFGFVAFVVYFGRLSLISALFWAPLLILSIAGLPKYWIKERW